MDGMDIVAPSVSMGPSPTATPSIDIGLRPGAAGGVTASAG